jgi:hypothetical protein
MMYLGLPDLAITFLHLKNILWLLVLQLLELVC